MMPVKTMALRHAVATLVCACLVCSTGSVGAQGGAQGTSQPRPTVRAGTELVTVNVVVRDRTGAVVRGLGLNDFVVTEDGKPQSITSFDFEELDREDAPPAPEQQTPGPILEKLPAHPLPARPATVSATGVPAAAPAAALPAAAPAAKLDMRGRRLIA